MRSKRPRSSRTICRSQGVRHPGAQLTSARRVSSSVQTVGPVVGRRLVGRKRTEQHEPRKSRRARRAIHEKDEKAGEKNHRGRVYPENKKEDFKCKGDRAFRCTKSARQQLVPTLSSRPPTYGRIWALTARRGNALITR